MEMFFSVIFSRRNSMNITISIAFQISFKILWPRILMFIHNHLCYVHHSHSIHRIYSNPSSTCKKKKRGEKGKMERSSLRCLILDPHPNWLLSFHLLCITILLIEPIWFCHLLNWHNRPLNLKILRSFALLILMLLTPPKKKSWKKRHSKVVLKKKILQMISRISRSDAVKEKRNYLWKLHLLRASLFFSYWNLGQAKKAPSF